MQIINKIFTPVQYTQLYSLLYNIFILTWLYLYLHFVFHCALTIPQKMNWEQWELLIHSFSVVFVKDWSCEWHNNGSLLLQPLQPGVCYRLYLWRPAPVGFIPEPTPCRKECPWPGCELLHLCSRYRQWWEPLLCHYSVVLQKDASKLKRADSFTALGKNKRSLVLLYIDMCLSKINIFVYYKKNTPGTLHSK